MPLRTHVLFAAALASCTPIKRTPARSTPAAPPPAAPPPTSSAPEVVTSTPGASPPGPNDAAPLPPQSNSADAPGPGSPLSCAAEAKTPISSSLERVDRDGVAVLRRAAGAKEKSCVEPTDELLASARSLVEQVSAEPRVYIRLGCGTSAGWLMEAQFTPKPTFRNGSPVECTGAMDCEPPMVEAVWHLPPAGKPRLIPGATDVQEPVDVDGDGELEGIATGARGTTVLFADGTSVTGKAAGAWMRLGKDLVLVQGGAAAGFAVSEARAFVVSRAGFVERPELVMPAWKTTFAARCPREPFAVVPPDRRNTANLSTEAARPCPQPSEDTRRTVTELILAALGDEARQTGLQVTDGPPHFAWGCEQPQLAVLVRYCSGHEALACEDEHGTWRHELWIRSPRGMTRATRIEGSSLAQEWEIYRSQTLVAHADLDGDGAPEPIFETGDSEGGAITSTWSYHTVARGRLFAFGPSDMSTEDLPPTTFPIRIPGAARDLIAIAYEPTPGDPVLTVWELGPNKMVRHLGPGVALAKQLLARRSPAKK